MTVSVKLCVAFVPNPFAAVIVIGKMPPAAGVPASVAVPSPLSTKFTPPGSAPVSVRPGAGKPVVVTVKVPGEPSVNVVPLALVIEGA